jgi:thiol-disulfide isomerase/thioredoxin
LEEGIVRGGADGDPWASDTIGRVNPAPDALLLIGPGCPHCAAMLQNLVSLVKEAAIGRLEVVNVAAHPEVAADAGVRSVPWTRIGIFEFDGALALGELRAYASGESDDNLARYFLGLLTTGRRATVEALARQRPDRLTALVRLLADPKASMAVRLGIGAVLEEFQGTGIPAAMVPGLGSLTRSGDRLTRTDACHFLGLTGSADALPYLRVCLKDDDAEVREIAREAIEALG